MLSFCGATENGNEPQNGSDLQPQGGIKWHTWMSALAQEVKAWHISHCEWWNHMHILKSGCLYWENDSFYTAGMGRYEKSWTGWISFIQKQNYKVSTCPFYFRWCLMFLLVIFTIIVPFWVLMCWTNACKERPACTITLSFLFFLKRATTESFYSGDGFQSHRIQRDDFIWILWLFFPFVRKSLLNFSYAYCFTLSCLLWAPTW